jgi:hypothetical protein
MASNPGQDVYAEALIQIGLITTTWAKFEHWIDQAIWLLAEVIPRKGAFGGEFHFFGGVMFRAKSAPTKFRTSLTMPSIDLLPAGSLFSAYSHLVNRKQDVHSRSI